MLPRQDLQPPTQAPSSLEGSQPIPIPWSKYSSVLRNLQERPGNPEGGTKRIAILGLPLLDRGPHPLKIAIADCLERYPGWQVVFMSDAYIDTFRILHKIPCDGILARVVSSEIAEIARSLPHPLVNISSMVRDPGVHTVRRDDRGIGRLCARHLLDRGFVRIGMVEIEPTPGWCFDESTSGFLETIANAGQPIELSRHRLNLNACEQDTMARFKAWLRTLQYPCALFLTDDRFALAAMETCRHERLRVPKDVAVISAAGTPETLHACSPTLTHPVKDAGWLLDVACQRLDELMRNPRQKVETIVVACPGLIQGESTDTISVDDPLVSGALELIATHFQEGINVADVVARLRCSRRALETRFIKLMNVTLHTYIIEERIRLAKKRIAAAQDCKLDAIARECGFSDPQAFRRAFIASTGLTPSHWRERNAPRPHKHS